MAEKYREFDAESTTRLSEVRIVFSRFSRRELFLGLTVIVCVLVIIVLAALLGSASSGRGSDTDPAHSAQTGDPTTCYTPSCLRVASHVLDLVNETAHHPCQDFYSFACSNFPTLHPLQPDEMEVTPLELLFRHNLEKVRRTLESISSTEDPDHYEFKVKSFYESCMNHFHRAGLKGTPLLEKMVEPSGGWWVTAGDGAWPPSGYSFQRQLEMVHVDYWTNAFFTFSPFPDTLNWNHAAVTVYLGGLGLHFFEYEENALVTAYEQYIRTVATLLIHDANLNVSRQEEKHRLDTFVSDVLFVETELATLVNGSKYERNAHELDRRPTLGDLNRNFSGELDWVSLFSRMFDTSDQRLMTASTRVVVYEQEYLQKFSLWLQNLNPANKTRLLNNYLVWRLADTYSRYLDWDYAHAYYRLQGQQASGSLDVPPTWQVCLQLLDTALPEAVGALFVRDHFSDASRRDARMVTDFVKKALEDSLGSQLHWMSPFTRHKAIQKLHETLIKLGYPDYMMNETTLNHMFALLTTDPQDYLGNLLSMHGATRRFWIQFLQHPNDRSLWVYPPYSTVLEYYNPWKELMVPAGILQFPVFDRSSPRYMNFGSLGSLVGKALTHAIDENGNEVLLDGSQMGSWWSVNTTLAYRSVEECIDNAYHQMSTVGAPRDLPPPMYAVHVLSESTGIKLAYKGYHEWTREQGQEKMMPGHKFTNNQMFFLSYAQTQCASRHPFFEDIHFGLGTPIKEKISVNNALAQLQEFQDAFKCPATSPMVAPKRCNLY